MAAITSTGTGGNWSSTGTWAGGVVPASGDTVTIAGPVTVDVDTTVGSSPATGGTAAIGFGTAGGFTLTVAAGKTLTVQGPIAQDAVNNGTSQIVLSAGASVVIKPASGQQYSWTFGQNSQIVCNGSIGNRCTIKTDKSLGGLASKMVGGSFRAQGVLTATFTDFLDFGDSSNFGVWAILDVSSNHSITDCTFTRCSAAVADVGNAWDGNLTFSRNRFTSSVTQNYAGYANTCIIFGTSGAASAGTRVVDSNSFDGTAQGVPAKQVKFTRNTVAGNYGLASGSAWPDATYFDSNILLYDDSVNGIVTFGGSIGNSYLLNANADNPHYASWFDNGIDISVTGCIAQNTGTHANGDVYFPPSTTTVLNFTVTRCLGLPNAAGLSSGKLVSALIASNSGIHVTSEHNTSNCDQAEDGLVMLGETDNSYAGKLASCRSNIAWSASATDSGVWAVKDGGTTTPATDAVTVAGHNGFLNRTAGTSTLNGVSTSTPGYTGLVCSTAGFPSTQLGQGDISGDPQFVDRTRWIGSWWIAKGHTTTGTFAGDAAAAVTYAGTDPATLIPDLLAYVRAGFRPTNPAYLGATYPGDPATTDAAGNPLGGTIGAMAFAASFLPVWAVRSSNQTLGCGVY